MMLAAAMSPTDPGTPTRPDRDARLRHLKAALHDRALRNGLTQADLCRATKLGRDSMSRYFNGITLPDPVSLYALARALDCSPKDLDPGFNDSLLVPAAANNTSPLEMRVDPQNPGMMFVRLNQSLPIEIAGEIMALLVRKGQVGGSD